MIVDVNSIINGTPTKRITLGFNTMKETYNESSAEEFKSIYEKENLSDILDNSMYIFSECYKGLDFYKDIILNESSCIFSRFNDELNKVTTYVEEASENISEDQKAKYDSLINDMKEFKEKYSDVILMASFINEKEEDFEKKISDALYKNDSDEVIKALESAYEDYALYIYAPYIVNNDNFNQRAVVNNMIIESSNSVKGFDNYVGNVIALNRVAVSDTYKKDLANLGNISSRYVIEAYINAEPIADTISNKLEITNKEAGVVLHEDSHDAVNSIFDDILEAALFEESYSSRKNIANSLMRDAYNKTMELLTFESSFLNPEDTIKGYSLIEDGMSYDDAFKFVSEHADMAGDDFFESSDEDDVDEGLNELSSYIDNDEDKDEDSKSENKKVNAKKEVKSSPTSTTSSNSKPIKPKAKNLSSKIQVAAQNAEVKQMEGYSRMKQKGAELGRAAKAVAQLPLNVVNDIKKQIQALEEKDIERRKAYMVSPGYRKRAFRNLKLAIMYGSAAQVKLSMVPMLAVVRHFSKKKDKFVRKELERELTTEIKVCEAKIEDAQNNNDQKEKYRLIRLKDELEHERIRVLFNAKRM